MTDDFNPEDAVDYSSEADVEELERQAACPTCGHEAPGSLTCPRCGARTQKGISLARFKMLALAGGILGLVLVIISAYVTAPAYFEITTLAEEIQEKQIKQRLETTSPSDAVRRAASAIKKMVTYPPHVSYEEPDSQGNFQITVNPARVRGRVTEIDTDPVADNFTLTLSDGGERLYVRGYGELSDFIDQRGEVFPPNLFDRVEVVGNLRIHSRYGPSMYMSVPQRFRVVEFFEDKTRALPSITSSDVGDVYYVEATVREVARPGELRVITLEDRNAYLDLAVFDWQFDELPSQKQNYLTSSGTRLKLLVEVGEYDGDVQLQLANPDDPETIEYRGD